MQKVIIVGLVLAACGRAEPVKPAPARELDITQVASPAEGIFANAYLVDTGRGVVVIDAALRVSDAKALRARVDATGKPLLAVLLTHGHPDHYNGAGILTAGTQAPIVATAEVDKVIREHDAAKEKQWKGMFGDEWPARRAFPTQIVRDGEPLQLGGVTFRAHTVGPAESHADTYWTIDGTRDAFVGDLLFSGMHSYISDGHTAAWLAALGHLEDALRDARIHPGHGKVGGIELVASQRRYLEALRAEVKRLAPFDDAKRAELVTAMKQHEPGDALAFLVGLGADAVAAELAAER